MLQIWVMLNPHCGLLLSLFLLKLCSKGKNILLIYVTVNQTLDKSNACRGKSSYTSVISFYTSSKNDLHRNSDLRTRWIFILSTILFNIDCFLEVGKYYEHVRGGKEHCTNRDINVPLVLKEQLNNGLCLSLMLKWQWMQQPMKSLWARCLYLLLTLRKLLNDRFRLRTKWGVKRDSETLSAYGIEKEKEKCCRRKVRRLRT